LFFNFKYFFMSKAIPLSTASPLSMVADELGRPKFPEVLRREADLLSQREQKYNKDLSARLSAFLEEQKKPKIHPKEFLAAILGGRLEEARRMVGSGSLDINARIPERKNGTMLHVAVDGDNLPEVKTILEAGALLLCDDDGFTPLHLAAMRGHEKVSDLIIAHLISKGRPDVVDVKSKKGRTALHTAAALNHPAIVSSLLAAGAQIDAVDNFGLTPLCAAASRGHVKVAEDLLAKGAGVEKEGASPLFMAAQDGHLEMVKFLFDRGAKLNSKNGSLGYTPLLIAVFCGHRDVAQFLMTKESDAKVTHFAHELATEEGHEGIAKMISEEMERKPSSEIASAGAGKVGKVGDSAVKR